MGITDFTTEEIEKELKKRAAIKKRTRPKLLKTPNLKDLIARCEEYIDLVEIDDNEYLEYGDLFHEEVILAIYGEAGWDYINYCEELNNKNR
jgi:hypothetical protein